MSHNRGFTLLELLVVIAIIGTLSSLIVPNFMSARGRARDAQRKANLKEVQNALELYRGDQIPPSYPADGTFLSTPGSKWSSNLGSTYMNRIPGDPSQKPFAYYYYKLDDLDSLKYTLCACLENTSDTDSLSGNCDATYTCASNRKYEVNEP